MALGAILRALAALLRGHPRPTPYWGPASAPRPANEPADNLTLEHPLQGITVAWDEED